MFNDKIPKIKSHKTNINPILFYIYISLIFVFVLVYSINFLVTQFIEKEILIRSLMDKYNDGTLPPVNSDEYNALYDHAKQVWNLWSLPAYLGGISTVFIFFVFVMFGRTKVKYGYFFRTIWAVVFMGAGVFVFFIEGMPMWQKVIDFIMVIGLAGVTLYDLVKVNKKREDIKFEIRNEWANNRNNRDVKEVK